VTRNGVAGDTAAVASQIVVDSLHARFNRDRPRFFASSNVAFPGEPFAALGGFDERFRYAEDRELCERWIRAGRRFAHAPDAVVLHMRRLTLPEFWRQHYGYGRGARAFARRRGAGERHGESLGVLREIASRGHAAGADHPGAALGGYLVLSQAATVAGFAREGLAAALGARRG
jgi:GT2 family glycosyltransferase